MTKMQLQHLAALLLLLASSTLAITPESRILGGDEAAHDATPHAVSLRIDNSHVCGATILSETKLLTAAHCLYRDGKAVDSSRLSGRVGSSNQFAGGSLVQVESYVIHPDYYKLENNLAVLTLSKALVWTERIKPIELYTPEDALPAAGSAVSMSGWGTTVEGSSSFKIRQLSMTFATDAACLDAYSAYDASKFFCLAHPLKEGGCNGDGGGGAIYGDKLLGVSNFIVGACGSRYPDVYIRVSGYYDWVQKELLA